MYEKTVVFGLILSLFAGGCLSDESITTDEELAVEDSFEATDQILAEFGPEALDAMALDRTGNVVPSLELAQSAPPIAMGFPFVAGDWYHDYVGNLAGANYYTVQGAWCPTGSTRYSATAYRTTGGAVAGSTSGTRTTRTIVAPGSTSRCLASSGARASPRSGLSGPDRAASCLIVSLDYSRRQRRGWLSELAPSARQPSWSLGRLWLGARG